MIVYCPTCFRPARLPDHREGLLECPHCLTAFFSSGQIGQLPYFTQQLEKVNDQHLLLESEQPTSLYNSDEILVEEDDTEEDSELQLMNLPEPVVVKPLFNLEAPKPTARRRKEKSALGSMIGVVLGGFAALPIATGIMWYAMGKDPFRIAPTVANYVPWIVPQKLSGRVVYRESNGATAFEDISSDTPKSDDSKEASYFSNDSLASANRELDSSKLMPPEAESSNGAPEEPTQSVSADPKEPVADLPFNTDGDNQFAGEDVLQLMFQNINKAFDEALRVPDDANVAKLFDELQRIAQQDGVELTGMAASLHFAQLESRFNEPTSQTLLRKLVLYSRKQLKTKSEGKSSLHVDGFAKQSSTAVPGDETLSVYQNEYELWLPSEQTREPMRSMRVVVRKDVEESEVSNKQFILLGQVVTTDSDSPATFVVLTKTPL